MEIWLSIVGFLVVIAIIVSIMTKKLSTMVALSVIPLIGAILVGQFASIPAFLVAGVSKVAVNGVMFFFAILFFGSMMTAGAFDPIVNFIIKCCRGNPLYVCIGTYVLSIVGHLDGSATTTVLLVCGAMVPIYRRMNMRLRNLAAILAMGAGLMNISPWGGPTLRAATVMEMDLTEFFQPMLIPILITIAVGLVPVVLIGLSETKRLKAEGFDYAAVTVETQAQELSDEARALLRPRLVIPNLILIVLVVGLMISGILSPAAAFLTGTALTWLLNYRKMEDQQKIMRLHGANAVFVVSALYGAGVPKIEIERSNDVVTIFLHCARPGMVIGKGGEQIEQYRLAVEKLVGKKVRLNIVEVRNPDMNAQLVAENIAQQLEARRLPPGHEELHGPRHAGRRQGHQDLLLRPSGRPRNRGR